MCPKDKEFLEIVLILLGLIYTVSFILMTKNINEQHKSAWWFELLGPVFEFAFEKQSLNEKGRKIRVFSIGIIILTSAGVAYRSYCY